MASPIPFRRRHLTLVLLLLGLSEPAPGQGSPYIPIDDPLLPLFEQLIARGVVNDPSPQVRPFRRMDAVTALRGNVKPEHVRAVIQRLLDRWDYGQIADQWELNARAGVQAYTTARADLLQPVRANRVEGVGDLGGLGTFGATATALRIRGENRIKRDPDWEAVPALQTATLAYRVVEGYVSAAWRGLRLHYGQTDRNWGPVGTQGLGVAHDAYSRADLGAEIHSGPASAWLLVAALDPRVDSSGTATSRATAAHRLAIRVAPTLVIALWETAIVATGDSPFGRAAIGLPIPLLLIDNANVIVGADVAWRPMRGLGLDIQLMVDRVADRGGMTGEVRSVFGWTVGAEGPAAATASWRVRWSRVPAEAYRGSSQADVSLDAFIDERVGTVRVLPDNDRVVFSLAVPIRASWLIVPDVSLLRQGPGRLSHRSLEDPIAPTEPAVRGPIRNTWRAGFTLRGAEGPLEIDAAAGLHHTRNADHAVGRNTTRLEARLRVSLGVSLRGRE